MSKAKGRAIDLSFHGHWKLYLYLLLEIHRISKVFEHIYICFLSVSNSFHSMRIVQLSREFVLGNNYYIVKCITDTIV